MDKKATPKKRRTPQARRAEVQGLVAEGTSYLGWEESEARDGAGCTKSSISNPQHRPRCKVFRQGGANLRRSSLKENLYDPTELPRGRVALTCLGDTARI